MTAALWIIAICEVIRVIQNGIQHMLYLYDIEKGLEMREEEIKKKNSCA